MTRSYNLSTRSRFCLVGFAVFCFLSAPVCASGQSDPLTQQELEDTLTRLFEHYLQSDSYRPTSYTVSDYARNIARCLLGSDDRFKLLLLDVVQSVPNYSNSLYQVSSILAGIGSTSNDLLRAVALLGSVSNQLDKTETGSYANTVDSWLDDIATGLYDETAGTPLLNKIRNLTYTSGSELRVHDQEAISYLYNLQQLLYSLYSAYQYGGYNISSNFYELKEAVETQTDDIVDYLDQDATDTEQDAQDEVDAADQYAEESLEETAEDYEYEVPDLEEPSEPTTPTPTDDSGVGDISLNVQHTPLITLTQGNASHTPSSPFLPAMEIDLMTTPGAANFLSDLSTLIRYGWDAIFAFLGFCLYYSTFRRIRNMLIATRAGGVPSGESFSLHYDPF